MSWYVSALTGPGFSSSLIIANIDEIEKNIVSYYCYSIRKLICELKLTVYIEIMCNLSVTLVMIIFLLNNTELPYSKVLYLMLSDLQLL